MTKPTLDEARLRESVARLAAVGVSRSPTYAPDCSKVAFVSDLRGLPQVWTMGVDGGWPELVIAPEAPVQSVDWSPEGSWLAYLVAPGGGLNAQVHLARPDGSEDVRITDGGRTNNWLTGWSADGRSVLLSSTRRTPEAIDSYLYDVESGELRLVYESRGLSQPLDVSPDGRLAVVSELVQRGDDNLYLVDLATEDQRLLTPHEPPGSFHAAAFSADGGTIYLSSNADRELSAFASVELTNGEPGPIEVLVARDEAELERVVLSRDRATALLSWNAGGRSELELVELASLTRTAGPAPPAEVVWSAAFSPHGREVALCLSGAAAPTDIWTLDRESGEIRQLTRSPHPGVDLDRLVRPELVRFATHDGLELSGWLYRPRDGVAGATVLSFHGGPESQERPWFNPAYQALVGEGIAVFAPNVRGSTGFGKTFVDLDNRRLRVDAIRDIRACADYAIDQGLAEPGRLGIMGGSYGGFMTMAGLVEYPELFGAGVDICGIVNFETFFANTEPWMSEISKLEYGDPDTEPDLLRDLSPIHRIDRVRAPTLVVHGENDTNVPVVEAEQVVEQLRARGVPVEYLLFPREGHGLTKVQNKVEAAVAIVRWFVQHLT